MLAVLRPSSWEWLLFLHLLAVFIFAGGLVARTVAAAAARATPTRGALLDDLTRRIDRLLLWPALVVLVATGLTLADRENVYSRGWVSASLAATGLLAVLVAAGTALRLRGARLIGPATIALLLVAFWLMTTKPGN